jgi:hypothetical protein
MNNAPEIANQNPETPAQNAPAPSDDAENSSLPAETDGEDAGSAPKGSVNLAKSFSKINTALIALADQYVRRSFAIPHSEGETPAQHFQSVGQVATQQGGLTKNLVLAEHSLHGTNGGVTVGYSADKLREVIIPKNDENAKAAIDATKSFVSKARKLLGNVPTVQTAQSQIELVGQHNGEGMTISDLVIGLINIPHPLIQNVARLHSGTKTGGHHPLLRAPKQ